MMIARGTATALTDGHGTAELFNSEQTFVIVSGMLRCMGTAAGGHPMRHTVAG